MTLAPGSRVGAPAGVLVGQYLNSSCVPFERHICIVCRFNQHTIIDTGGLPLDNRSLKKDVLIDEPKVVVQLGHSSGEDPLAGGLLLLLLLTLLALLALLLL